MKNILTPWNQLFITWLISCIASAASLFFSEVMLYPPCVLCWYQRIAMYPLTILLLVGLFPLNKNVIKFSLPVAIIGLIVAIYHNLLHLGIIPEQASPCREGVSCSTVFLDWFGFVTIPLLSLVAFALIISSLLILRKRI